MLQAIRYTDRNGSDVSYSRSQYVYKADTTRAFDATPFLYDNPVDKQALANAKPLNRHGVWEDSNGRYRFDQATRSVHIDVWHNPAVRVQVDVSPVLRSAHGGKRPRGGAAPAFVTTRTVWGVGPCAQYVAFLNSGRNSGPRPSPEEAIAAVLDIRPSSADLAVLTAEETYHLVLAVCAPTQEDAEVYAAVDVYNHACDRPTSHEVAQAFCNRAVMVTDEPKLGPGWDPDKRAATKARLLASFATHVQWAAAAKRGHAQSQ